MEDMRETSARQIETNEKSLKDKWQRAELDTNTTQVQRARHTDGPETGRPMEKTWETKLGNDENIWMKSFNTRNH